VNRDENNNKSHLRGDKMPDLYDCLIIGAGPAGLSAAIYAGRARLSTIVFENIWWVWKLKIHGSSEWTTAVLQKWKSETDIRFWHFLTD